jgi:hypothetical protein
VRNLRQRSILDHNCTPNFQSLSTEGLVKAVKHLVTGPQAWHVGSTPKVSKKSSYMTLRSVEEQSTGKSDTRPNYFRVDVTSFSRTGQPSSVGMFQGTGWFGRTRRPSTALWYSTLRWRKLKRETPSSLCFAYAPIHMLATQRSEWDYSGAGFTTHFGFPATCR